MAAAPGPNTAGDEPRDRRLGFDLVIFDCDGVLVDSERLNIRTEAAIVTSLGWPLTEDDVVSGSSAAPPPTCRPRSSGSWAAGGLGGRVREPVPHGPGPPAAPRRRRGRRARTDRAHRLRGLERHPREDPLLPRPDRALLDRFEGRIFSVEDVLRGKPAPDLFLHAAASWGTRPARCAVVEDSVSGVQAALAAGMTVFAYAGGVTPATGWPSGRPCASRPWPSSPASCPASHRAERPFQGGAGSDHRRRRTGGPITTAGPAAGPWGWGSGSRRAAATSAAQRRRAPYRSASAPSLRPAMAGSANRSVRSSTSACKMRPASVALRRCAAGPVPANAAAAASHDSTLQPRLSRSSSAGMPLVPPPGRAPRSRPSPAHTSAATCPSPRCSRSTVQACQASPRPPYPGSGDGGPERLVGDGQHPARR